MGVYYFHTFIDSTTDAVNKVLVNTSISTTRPSCVSVVGTLAAEEILLQIPVNNDPDGDVDADWQTLSLDGDDQKLTASNMAISIPVGFTVRVKKPATTNAVGVRWS